MSITIVESPDVPTIGVGEGTWPTMRRTLERIGIDESEFLLACDASFKQGTRFDGWRDGSPEDVYYHPFVPPDGDASQVVAAWQDMGGDHPYADAICPQPRACALNLAPRQRAMPDYTGALNYAYHLDAGKLAVMLQRHATGRLGVRHVRDHVSGIERTADGDIAAVRTRASGRIDGDLFIDCTGQAALLLAGEFNVPFVDRSGELFNDRALAVQVPVDPDSPVASQTNATAHAAGWIWDIGLPTRRGVGCVYSSVHASDDDATNTLMSYLRNTTQNIDAKSLAFRRLDFRSGHRKRFWERNCLAIGLSAGFLEPLEASAIVMIELSLEALLDHFPHTRGIMEIQAERFNAIFSYRWDRIVEFLKLHYALSQREEPYWRDHRDAATIPPRLSELLQIWHYQCPSRTDFTASDEVFPAASYQYILYGMGFPIPILGSRRNNDKFDRNGMLHQVKQRSRVLASSLPTNRSYLTALRHASAQRELNRAS